MTPTLDFWNCRGDPHVQTCSALPYALGRTPRQEQHTFV